MKSEFDKMVEFLDSTYMLKDQLVPCLIGPVGIGKTDAVKQHAKNVGAKNVVKIVASQILPNEVSGITMPDPDTKAMEIYDHFKLGHMKDGDILFFDELLEADQSVLKACLTLIESRELMSGRSLPDIQIVAATNPSIQPMMLGENIRQRFLFRSFVIDRDGTAKFIKQDCDIDVLGIVDCLEATSTKYNILSPRSLTKMARWMASTKTKKEGKRIAEQINKIWGSGLGDKLFESKFKDYDKKFVKNEIRKAVSKYSDAKDIDWENDTMVDLIRKIQDLPEWQDIKNALNEIEMEES